MVNSFPNFKTNWSISAVDISLGSDPNEIRLLTQLIENTVEAIGWTE